jgi:undecaprenyl-diphosphatase
MDEMPVPAVVPGVPPCLHLNPPATPAAFFASRRRLLVGIIVAFGFLGVAAATANSWLLLRLDKPFQHFVEANRGDELDTLFRLASRFGSTMVVLSLGALLALLTWSRCRAVSVALVVATFGRPLVEFTFKELVGRDRPDLNRLVEGNGPSFPSGHPMAAIALWGMLPVVVALFTHRRAIWWATVAFSGVMIVGIAASRVYLGVHWLSDVVGGHRAHGKMGCASEHRHLRRRAGEPALQPAEVSVPVSVS